MNLMNFRTFLLGLVFISFVSCNSDQSAKGGEPQPDELKPVDNDHNAQTSLDYAGTYKGLTPCADCEGIEVELTLKMDNTYMLTTVYLGKENDNKFTVDGTYTWSGGNTIELSGITDGPSKYFVGENQLWQLDLEGNKVEGDLADKYILKKSM